MTLSEINLINNAFYAVNEKSKQGIAGYEPTVSVNTATVGNKLEIKVRRKSFLKSSIKILLPIFLSVSTLLCSAQENVKQVILPTLR